MDDNQSTIPNRPLPKRLPNGFLAWQATIGYISTQHSPDALLKLHVYPVDDESIGWGASAAWGQYQEEVWDRASFAAALSDLWQEVDSHYLIFESQVDALKSPARYPAEKWLDAQTEDILHRLIWITGSVFGGDWKLVIVYQPVENPSMRVQARLIAYDGEVHVGGRGGSLLDACHDLYRNGAAYFANAAGRLDE
jgi:hypothetical protein